MSGIAIPLDFSLADPREPAMLHTPETQALVAHNLRVLVPQWITNARANVPRVEESFADHAASLIDFYPEAERLDRVALIGSGPTLDEHLEELCTFPGVILCGVTALGALLANGITPHAVVAIDCSPQLANRLHFIPKKLRAELKLLASPNVSPAVMDCFKPENRFYFLSHVDGTDYFECPRCNVAYYRPIPADSYPINHFFRMLFPEFYTWIPQGGNVGNAMLALVARMQDSVAGYNITPSGGQPITREPSLDPEAAILLYGYDHGYPGGKARHTQWIWQKYQGGITVGSRGTAFHRGSFYTESGDVYEPEPQPDPPLSTSTQHFLRVGSLLTDDIQIAYKRSLMTWWYLAWHSPSLAPQYVFNASLGGMLTEMPHVKHWGDLEGWDWKACYTKELVGGNYNGYLVKTGLHQAFLEAGHEAWSEGEELVGEELNMDYWRSNA